MVMMVVMVVIAKAPTALAPTFTATPSIHQTGDGNVEFEVRLACCPAPTIQWYKGTTAISDGGRYRAVTHTDGTNYILTLTIIGVTKEDGGAYKVTAKTAAGESNASINLNLEGSSVAVAVAAPSSYPRFNHFHCNGNSSHHLLNSGYIY